MRESPKSTFLLILALLLALLGDLLLRGASWGVNVGLWAVALAGTVRWLSQRSPLRITRTGIKLGSLALVFALVFSWRDSNALKIANGVALVFCVGGLMLPDSGRSLRESSFGKLLFGPIVEILSLPAKFFALGLKAREERKASPAVQQRWKAIGRGLLLAAPLLLVFGALFADADAVYRQKIENIGRLNLDFGALSAHFWTMAFCLALGGGLLYRLVLLEEPFGPPVARPHARGSVGIIEISIVLGSLNLLFGSFIAVQFRYLFGGGDVLAATHGLSYAQYARGGFFQLLWVAALAMVVLLSADSLLKTERQSDEAFYRWLGRLLVVLVFFVVASAPMRMKLYTDAFGLTELRIYSTVFMGWLTLAFAWLLLTTLNGRRQRFAFGTLLAGLLVIFCTNCLNPDTLIVRTNLAKPNADFAYLTSLSDDAILAMRDMEGKLPAETKNLIRRRRLAAMRSDWRELNLSRWMLGH